MPFSIPKVARTRLNTNARDRGPGGALVAKTCVELFALGRVAAAAAVFEGFVREDSDVERWERACVALEFIEALQDGAGRRMMEEGQADVAREWLADQFESVAAEIEARWKRVAQGDLTAGEWSWLDTRADLALSEAVGAAAGSHGVWTAGALIKWADSHPNRLSFIGEAVQGALISDSRQGLAEDAGVFLIHPQRELWKMQEQVNVLRENADILARRSPGAMAAMVAEVAERLNDGSLPLSIAVSAGQIALSAWASQQVDSRHESTHISEWKDKNDRFAPQFFEKMDALIQACSPNAFWADDHWRAPDESQESKKHSFSFDDNRISPDASENSSGGAQARSATHWDTLRFACWNVQLGPEKEDAPAWTRWFIRLREETKQAHTQRPAGVPADGAAQGSVLSPSDFALSKSDLANLLAKSKTAQFAIIQAMRNDALPTDFASWGISLGQWHKMCLGGAQKWIKDKKSLESWDTAFTAVCEKVNFAPSGAAWIGLAHMAEELGTPSGMLSKESQMEKQQIKESNGAYYDADASMVIQSAMGAVLASSPDNPLSMVLLAFQEMARRKTSVHAPGAESDTLDVVWEEGKKKFEKIITRNGARTATIEAIDRALEALVLSRIADLSRESALGVLGAQSVSEATRRAPRL